MQIDLSAPYVVAAASLAVTIQGIIVGVAVMIRGTAKDLARESRSREEAGKIIGSRLSNLEEKTQAHEVALASTSTRLDAAVREIDVTSTATTQHATAISALEAWREHTERRRRKH